MRILLLHQYFLEPNDGGGARFNEKAKVWSELGHDITVIAGMIHANANEKLPEYKGKYFFEKKHDNVRVIRCHVSESYNTNFLGRLWGYFSFVVSSFFAGLFKVKSRFDVVIVTSPPLFLGITGYLLSRLKRIPLVFEVRDLWPESAIDTGVVKNKFIIKLAFGLEKFLYKKAKLINVLTPAFQKTLIEKKQIDQRKIIYIPNAADFTLANQIHNQEFSRESLRKELGVENKKVIIYVGAHGVANHLIQVIQTAELIKKRLPNVVFLLIGNGMEKSMLINEAENRNLDNIIFLDPVSKIDIFKYIMAADFGASVLKKVDTFKTIYSNKTFDYMSCKKPIMMVIDGVSRDLVESAECGIFIEPEDPKDWANKISQLLKKSDLELNAMGQNGYNYAQKHFDRVMLAKKYIDSIESEI